MRSDEGDAASSTKAPLSLETVVTDASTAEPMLRRLAVFVEEGPDAGQRRALDGTLLVGSHPDMDLQLHDDRVSRRHLELVPRGSFVDAKDLGSRNGVHLGPAKIDRARVGVGARLRLGKTVLRVEASDAPLAPGHRETLGELRAVSRAMTEVFALLHRVAQSDSPVLLEGETGTGKGAIAEAIHRESGRKGRLVVCDCGALSPHQLGAELFGSVKGAFPGAEDRPGAIEDADEGTLFLDHVHEIPAEVQSTFLRALDTYEVRRVGGAESRRLDLRVVAASREPLESAVGSGKFRQELFFRLAVVRVCVPPLRSRTDDIPGLVRAFISEAGVSAEADPEDLALLSTHHWPGNVRELRNLVLSAAAARAEGPLRLLPDDGRGAQDGPPLDLREALDGPYREARASLIEEFERRYVMRLLSSNKGNIARAARQAAVDRNYIYRLIKKYGLDREAF